MAREKKISQPSDEEILQLINAFKDFDGATAALNNAYRTLEAKIDDLRAELDEKNRMLSGNAAETAKVKHFLTNILENITSGVVVIDNNEIITVFNRTASDITGFNPEEVTGKHYSEVFGEPTEPKYSLTYTLKTEKSVYRQEKTFPTSYGDAKPIIFSTTIISDENEELLGAVEIFEDLSEIKNLQEQVHRNRTLIELGEMAANIAHEIRNPLGGIGGFATLLERDLADDPEKQKLVSRIIEGINGLNKITSDVLAYTRKMEPDIKPADIKLTIQDAISLVSVEAEKRGVKIEFNHPKENIEVNADSNLMKNMLLNLMKNSIHAMPDGGSLTLNLSWKLMHNELNLVIKDSGNGIDKTDQDKIFNPFYTTDSRGTGLGLAIVRRIVEVHGGDIKVKSEKGKGTEFQITLPIIQQI